MNASRSIKGFVQLLICLAILIGLTQTGLSQAMPIGKYNFTTITASGATETWASGINDKGQVVGQYRIGNSPWFSFLRSGDADYPITVGKVQTGAHGINRLGDIVGFYSESSTSDSQGFLSPGVGFSTINPRGGDHSSANGINDKGAIVGESNAADFPAFVYSGGEFTAIIYPGRTGMSALGINNKGYVVGTAGTSGYVYQDGVFTLIDVEGASSTAAIGINNSGAIVGIYYMPNSQIAQGFLLSNGMFSRVEFPGAIETIPTDINNHGQIVGRYTDTLGTYGFIAEPQKGRR